VGEGNLIENSCKKKKCVGRDLITKLENLLKQEQREQFQKDFEPKTLDQLNKEVDLALEDFTNDTIIKSSALLEKYREWD